MWHKERSRWIGAIFLNYSSSAYWMQIFINSSTSYSIIFKGMWPNNVQKSFRSILFSMDH